MVRRVSSPLTVTVGFEVKTSPQKSVVFAVVVFSLRAPWDGEHRDARPSTRGQRLSIWIHSESTERNPVEFGNESGSGSTAVPRLQFLGAVKR